MEAKIISSEEESPEVNQQAAEIQALEQKKAFAETQEATAKALKAAVEALLPASKLQPQEGKTEADEKFGYAAELVAYQVLKEQGKQIGKEIEDELGAQEDTKVLIVNDLDFATGDLALVHLEALCTLFADLISEQRADNEKISDQILPEGEKVPSIVAAAGLVVAGLVGAAADILGYFKTDYVIKGQEFDLKDHALIASVLGNITQIPVQVFKFHAMRNSEVLSTFTALLPKKNELHASLRRLQFCVKLLNDKIKEAKTHAGSSGLLAEANAAILATETLLTAISNFTESVTKTPEDKSLPLLLKAALRKHVETEGFTHLLNLRILSAGGEAVTMQQRIGRSGKLIFIGGCAVSYVLAQINGTCVKANTHHGLAHLKYDLWKPPESLRLQRIHSFQQNQQTRARE